MRCRLVLRLIDDHVDGLLPARRSERVRAHLEACPDCHAEADPAVRTPVGENVLPPYYANPGSGHPDIPDDPCNPPPGFTEDFEGAPFGIDNDGDLLADQDDPDSVVRDQDDRRGRDRLRRQAGFPQPGRR